MAALLAVLAITATVASAYFTSSEEASTNLSGVSTGVKPTFDVPGFGTVKCDSQLTGQTASPTPSWILQLSFQNCSKEGVAATVNLEKCLVRFVDPDEPLQLIGDNCEGIDLTAGCWQAHVDRELGGSTSYGNLQSSEGANTRVLVRAEASGLHADVGGCGFPDREFTGGGFRAEWDVSGKSESGEKFVSIGSTESTPAFRAAQVPAGITGQASGNHRLETKSSALSCSELSATPTWTPTNQTEPAVTVTDLDNCTFYGVKPTVDFGGCSLIASADGTLEIAGTACAEDPVTVFADLGLFGTCTMTVGSQTKSSAVAYSNGASEEIGFVQSEIATNTMTYSQTGTACGTTGTFNDGKYSGGIELSAVEFGAGSTDLQYLD